MPDVKVEKTDVLDIKTPSLSSTDDMPKVETTPDVIVPKKDAEAEVVVDEEVSQPSTEQPEVPAASDEPKKAKGVQKRIDELVNQREDNRRRAEAAEARLDRALKALEQTSVKEAKPEIKKETEEDAPRKPVKSDFTDPDAYDTAVENYVSERASWIARREVNRTLAEERQKSAEQQLVEQQKKLYSSYAEKISKARQKYSDFDQVAESPVQITQSMANAIVTYEDGTDLQYYLGKNPAEATRIASLPVERQLMELGVIAAGLKQPAQKAPVSQAPSPGKPIKTSGEIEPALDDLPMEEYAKKVREREAAKRKPGGRLYS